MLLNQGHIEHVLIPQWGGISLIQSNDEKAFRNAMSHYLQHLYSLLHMPLDRDLHIEGISTVFEKHHDGSPPKWMVAQMKRSRSIECFKKSKDTLSALIRLTERIPTMTIRDRIAQQVNVALSPLMRAAHQESISPTWQETRTSFVQSDIAFFDETMVSQLYFPDEHTFAIYLPLFLPITISLAMMTIKEVKALIKRRRLKQKAE